MHIQYFDVDYICIHQKRNWPHDYDLSEDVSSTSIKFDRVLVTKVYQKSDDLVSEEQHEIFNCSFRQAGAAVRR